MDDDQITMTTNEAAGFGCAALGAGVVLGVATVVYAAYKVYEAVANSDTEISISIKEGKQA